MQNLDIAIVIGIASVVAVVVILALLMWRSRQVNLTDAPPNEKPERMRSTPPPETVAVTRTDREGITLYDYDRGEQLAAPFAEQIEDILRSQLSADPELCFYDVDFGTAPDGGLEIHVGGECYTDIEQIPDERLRAAIKRAIAAYNQRIE